MNFLNIPANYDFLESLCKFILDNFGNKLNTTDLTILLPSRRSVNELKRIFLKNSKSKSLILPTMKALGDIDYDDIVLAELDYDLLLKYDELTKPVSNIKYKLLLIKKILENNKDINVEQSINLSKELDSFLKETIQQDLSLDDLSSNIVDDEYAIHWQKILIFLKDFGKKWQDFLNGNNLISNSASIVKKIDLYTKSFELNKPKDPIIIAGNFVSIKSTLKLVETLKKYDNTYFIFSDYKKKCNIDNVDEINNFYYNNKILENLNVNIENIKNLHYDNCKTVGDELLETIHNSMLPHDLTYKWHNLTSNNLSNINYMECENIYEEFNLITFYILDYINKNGLKNIAVISNIEYTDKLELYLKEWNLPVNNTFGKKFLNNKLVKYILLVIEVFVKNFDKESILTLLKSDFSYFGYTKEELNNNIINFENYVLNNKRNCKGFASYRKNILLNIDNSALKESLLNFVERMESYFNVFNAGEYSLKDLIIVNLKLVENLTTDINNKDSLIWYKNNIYQKILDFFNNDFILQADCYGKINLKDYYSILQYILSEQSYSDNYSVYPAINIISAQESRLINYDLVVITNLNDGVFPINISTDPWMSKSMRQKFGLPAKETEIGKSAYDFVRLLSQRNVLLTRSIKINGTATFKSRFLQRLETFLKCNNMSLNKIDCSNFIEEYKINHINDTINNNIYKTRPCPKPQLSVRPKKLSATNINLLKENPYDIYAKYILKLTPMNVLQELKLNSNIGTIIHKVVEDFVVGYELYKNDEFLNIKKLLINEINKNFIDDDVFIDLYSNKFFEILSYFITLNKESLKNSCKILTEEKKEYYMKNIDMKITAIIDRIEQSGNDINIIDYKTGTVPTKSEVVNGKKLQLLIEALILNKEYKLNIKSLQYWAIKYKNNSNVIINDSDKVNIKELIIQIDKFLNKLFSFFNDEKNGYIATNKNEYSDYKQLSRIDDWLSS